jgi:tetratricopeptide (TPR) repeat protein
VLHRPRSSFRVVATVLLSVLLAVNALWRGGVDREVTIASLIVAVAALGLAAGRHADRHRSVPVLSLGLAGIALLTATQLAPLPAALVGLLSPATRDVLDGALGPIGPYPRARPLSLDPGATALALAHAATWTAVAAAAGLLSSSADRRDRLLRAIALTGVGVMTVYVGAALLGIAPLVAPKVTFVNPNHLAGFLQVAAWTALGFALRSRGPARAGWLLAFGFTGAGVFLSLSRAGIAAFFVGAGIFGVLRMRAGGAPRLRARSASATLGANERVEQAAPGLRSGRTGGGTGSGKLVFVGALAGALAIAAFLALDPIIAELRTVSEESTTEAKLGLWPTALEIVSKFPLTGIGRGAFATVHPAYKWEAWRTTFTHVENEWLQLPVDLGVPVGVGIILLFAWAYFAAARRRDLSRPLAGALAGAGALVAHNLFDFSLEIPGVAIPFAVVLGIAARDMRSVPVARWVVRAGATALLLLGGMGIALHLAHATETDSARVARATTADEALALAPAALRWHPADWLPPAAVGTKLAAEGRCAEALPWLTRAMQRSPTSPEPHRAMAGCLARGGGAALARREYRLAFLYGDRDALAEAFRAFPEPGALVELAPDTPAGLFAAGALLRERPAEAREVWRRAWESFQDPRALARLAEVTLALGEREAALTLARELQEVAPDQPAGYVVASRALDALGQPDAAQRQLELGASRLPGRAEVLVPLGYRHLGQQRFSQARAVFEGILAREDGEVARKHVHVARALEGQGRFGEALREAQAARDAAPDDVAALEAFSRIAARVGRHDEAIEAIELAAQKASSSTGVYDARLAALRAAREAQRHRRLEQGLSPP